MACKSEKDLNETQRSQWLKAVAAIEMRNFDYAISLLQGVLKQQPEFLTGRQLLRRAEVTRTNAAKKSLFNISTAPIAVMKAQREMKKDPKRAMEMLEKVLEEEPYHKQANLALKEAAVASGCLEIGVFALKTVLENSPRDVKVLYELGRLHHELGENDQAVEVYNRISEIDPLDAEALRLGKDASARASMKSGGWTQAESYRALIKDREAAISLEQQGRMRLSGESLDRQIDDAHKRHQADPQNVDLVRQLGSLNEQKEDFESAIVWYQSAVDLTRGADAGLVRKVADLRIKHFECEIAALEEFLAAHPTGDERAAEAAQKLNAARQKREELLIGDARERVVRNPTDLQLRFELGERLVNANQFRQAVPELQRARQSPNARLKAMNLLGRCYAEQGMLDLAVKQLQEASREILTMDAIKKEIVYNLGLAYERMGDREKSLDCMKQIYEADYGYKDVAQRVETSYQQDLSQG